MRARIGDIVKSNFNGRIGIDGRKGLGQIGLFLIVDEIFLHLRSLHLIDMLVNAIERAILKEQFDPGLFSNLSDTWDIIRLISHQGLEIDKLLRCQSHLFFQIGWSEFFKLCHSFF